MKHNLQAGFTLTEMMVTLGIFSILVGIVVINVIHLPQQVSLGTEVTTLVADAKSQQLRSMLGDEGGTTTPQTFGVFFQSNSYTLFAVPYNANDPNNYTVTLSSDLTITNITLPSSQIIFNRVSGEVQNYAANTSSLVVKNVTNNEQHTITFNRYGVVTEN